MDEISGISILKEFGFAAVAYVLIYVMLKQEQKKSSDQYEAMVEFSKNVITSNTQALTHMNDALVMHMQQKEQFIGVMGKCAEDRDERLRRIEARLEGIESGVGRIDAEFEEELSLRR